MDLNVLFDGGPFGLLANALGAGALGLNALRLASRGELVSTRAVVALTSAALLVGVCGWATGLNVAASALSGADLPPEQLAMMWRQANGIALLPLQQASAWAALGAMLLCWSRSPAQRG